jgi:CRISPR-associated endonuclease/helicase Cas3
VTAATLFAKSRSRGGVTLADHTAHVVATADRIGDMLGFDVERVRQGAVLHDLGKSHPAAQAMLLEELPDSEVDVVLTGAPWADAVRKELKRRRAKMNVPVPHRHELSSLLFLPLFPADAWPQLIDMVVAHHRSILNDASKRGLLDLIEYDGVERVLGRHSEGWAFWAPTAIEIAVPYGVATGVLSLDEAEAAFRFAAAYAEGKPRGWSPWRGVLMAADHFASAFGSESEAAAGRMFRVPDLRCYDRRAAEADAYRYPLSACPTDDPRRHTLVIAPTGAGKTDFLLRRCRGRVFYTLPFQASINAMYLRILGDLTGDGTAADVRRLHAASRIELPEDKAEREEEIELQRHPGASVKVMTPHQLAGIVFGTPGHESIAPDLAGQDVVLDEIHTYDDLARAMVEQIVRTLKALGCRVHIGSATIPKKMGKQLLSLLGGTEEVHHVRLPRRVLDTFDRHVVHRVADENVACETLQRLVAARQRVLFVSNRVDRAQKRFQWIRESLSDVPAMLIHSRFRRTDRAALEREIRRFEERSGPCVVCATQVIEVSLDISFDAMITDAAPLDALAQRFGRVNRRRLSDPGARELKSVFIVAPPERERECRPYSADIVRRSYQALPSDGEVLRERWLQRRISSVYPEMTTVNVERHFIMNPDGSYRIRELENRKGSVIIDALEIESATAILQSDRAEYERMPWDKRSELEIPVPRHIHRFAQQWGRIERGSYPVVVPDEHYNPGGVPLGLVLPDSAVEKDVSTLNRMI